MRPIEPGNLYFIRFRAVERVGGRSDDIVLGLDHLEIYSPLIVVGGSGYDPGKVSPALVPALVDDRPQVAFVGVSRGIGEIIGFSLVPQHRPNARYRKVILQGQPKVIVRHA